MILSEKAGSVRIGGRGKPAHILNPFGGKNDAAPLAGGTGPLVENVVKCPEMGCHIEK